MVRVSSYVLSVLLHICVLGFALYWPMSQRQIDLNIPIYEVDLVTLAGVPGKPGDPGDPGPGKTPQVKAQAKPAAPAQPEAKEPPKLEPKAPQTALPAQPVKPAQPVEEPVQPAPPPEKGKDISEKKMAPQKPTPKEKPKPAEAQKPEPKKQPAKTEPEPKKKEPPKKNVAQEVKPAKPKSKNAAVAKPEQQKQAQPTKEQILAQALQAAQKDAAKQEKQDRDVLARELAELRDSVAGSGGTGPGTGTGTPDGAGGQGGQGGLGGQAGAYLRAVAQIVKDRWSFPNLDNSRVLSAQIEIRLSNKGDILDSQLIVSSGRDDFDASTLKAVAEAQQFNMLPAPPRGLNVIRINFNSQELR